MEDASAASCTGERGETPSVLVTHSPVLQAVLLLVVMAPAAAVVSDSHGAHAELLVCLSGSCRTAAVAGSGASPLPGRGATDPWVMPSSWTPASLSGVPRMSWPNDTSTTAAAIALADSGMLAGRCAAGLGGGTVG